MKLLSLLFAGTLLLPSAVSAETWWLLISGTTKMYGGLVLEKIPMESEEQCNAAGDTIYNSKDLEKPNNLHELYAMHTTRYICIKGK